MPDLDEKEGSVEEGGEGERENEDDKVEGAGDVEPDEDWNAGNEPYKEGREDEASLVKRTTRTMKVV